MMERVSDNEEFLIAMINRVLAGQSMKHAMSVLALLLFNGLVETAWAPLQSFPR